MARNGSQRSSMSRSGLVLFVKAQYHGHSREGTHDDFVMFQPLTLTILRVQGCELSETFTLILA